MNTMDKGTILYHTLERALTWTRPHNTPATVAFTDWLEDRVPKHVPDYRICRDKAGNLHVDNRDGPMHRTLFVAHVDTVHRVVSDNPVRKTETHWYADGGMPLGADDGAGCALLMHLLHADTKGYYVFTQGEECGGIGARHLAEEHHVLLSEFDRAIAFDRRGVDSVITHQSWGRCCSDLFGDALAMALNGDNDDLMYARDDTGVYTDTAEFMSIIPECTNVSVGYLHEHTAREELNILHYKQLADAVLRVNWDGLPTSRDPSVQEDNLYETSLYDTNWYGVGLTTVKGIDHMTDSTWQGYLDPDSEEVLSALYEARDGYKNAVLTLAARAAYPDDQELALKHMQGKKLTDEILNEIIEDTEACLYSDANDILLDVFDAVHTY